ncbi:MAG: MBL fold metallo-hydrolase RNA specificity domain-containing protein [Planctomycetota bacterium]|jgi:metallo-beta-lactamase family protein
MKLQFLGANRQVTGSRYLLEGGGLRVMVDCGLFQQREDAHRNWDPSPVAPEDVDRLLLTHAHLDHSGLLPKFAAEGYAGPVLTTPASMELARIVLEDAARIQEEDAAYKKRRHEKEGRRGRHPEVPLYTGEDAEAALRLFQRVVYDEPVALNEHVEVRYHDAGHILGSAMIEVTVRENGEDRRVVFSGDIGPWTRPLANDPAVFAAADYVVMESTYGDRDHQAGEPIPDELARIINDAVERGGNVVIPTFAIDRAQAVLFHLGELVRARRIPRLTIFVDSPMAVDVTTIYKGYRHLLDEEAQRLFDRGEHPFQFPGLHYVRSRDESIAINSIRGTCVVMAGSGMCTGGRVKHHLRHNISRPESTVLFVGFQARGTLGRQIVDGEQQVRVHGRLHAVNAQIEQLHGLSAHADRTDLMRWLGHFTTPPRRLFLTHGESRASDALADLVRTQLGWDVQVPEYGASVDLG